MATDLRTDDSGPSRTATSGVARRENSKVACGPRHAIWPIRTGQTGRYPSGSPGRGNLDRDTTDWYGLTLGHLQRYKS